MARCDQGPQWWEYVSDRGTCVQKSIGQVIPQSDCRFSPGGNGCRGDCMAGSVAQPSAGSLRTRYLGRRRSGRADSCACSVGCNRRFCTEPVRRRTDPVVILLSSRWPVHSLCGIRLRSLPFTRLREFKGHAPLRYQLAHHVLVSLRHSGGAARGGRDHLYVGWMPCPTNRMQGYAGSNWTQSQLV